MCTIQQGCCCETTPGEYEVELGAPFPMMDRPPHEGEFSVSADRERQSERLIDADRDLYRPVHMRRFTCVGFC